LSSEAADQRDKMVVGRPLAGLAHGHHGVE
jgi:hypothetical protein